LNIQDYYDIKRNSIYYLKKLFGFYKPFTNRQKILLQLMIEANDTDLKELLYKTIEQVPGTLKTEFYFVVEGLPQYNSSLFHGTESMKKIFNKCKLFRSDSPLWEKLVSSLHITGKNKSNDKLFHNLSFPQECGITSGMSIILSQDKDIFGVLGAYTKKKRVFTSDDIFFLETIAYVLTNAFARKKAQDSFRLQQELFFHIRKIIDKLITTPGEEKYFHTLDIMMSLIESTYGFFGYIDEYDRLIYYSFKKDTEMKQHILDNKAVSYYGTVERVLKDTLINKKAYSINESLLFFEEHTEVNTIISIPIVFHSRIIGFLAIANKGKNYKNNHRECVEKIANSIAPVFHVQLRKDKYKTQQKQTHEALSQSQERYYNIFRNAAVAIWEEDFSEVKSFIDDLKSQGMNDFKKYLDEHPDVVQKAIKMVKVIDVNDEAVMMYEAKSKEELLTSLDRIIVPETYPVIKDILTALYEGSDSFEAETVNRTLRGKQIDIFMTISSFSLASEINHLLVTIMDISELKQTKKDLRKQRDIAQKYLDIAGVIFVVIDRQECISLINQKGCDVLGWKKEEIIGQNWFEKCLPQRIRDKVRKVFRSLCEGEIQQEQIKYYENPVICKNGEERIVAWHNSIIKDENGQIVSVFASGEDITDRLMLEEQLHQSQKMEAIGRLAGGVAHDFNNLLTVITGYSEIICDRLQHDDPLRSKVEEIMKATTKATSLTQQLLTFSRKQMTHLNVINLNSIISEMKEMLSPLVGENIQLITNLDPTQSQIRADSGQIEQVIMNLVVNARDALPGGGTITIKTRKILCHGHTCPSEQSLIHHGPYVMLTISDTGCGMDKETKTRIFEPFFTTKGQDKGTGLGLSSVYSIVKQMSGYIWVSSELHHGTTFTIYIPACEDTEMLPEPTVQPREFPKEFETILIVEDEEAVRKLARTILEERGYTVFEAGNGDAALKLCKKQNGQFHLVITDIIMPGMNGQELAQKIMHLYPHIKIIYISGYSEDTTEHQGIDKGRIRFLKKPLAPSTLLCTVREVIDTS
jgi:PAS domain S-box-containing protein